MSSQSRHSFVYRPAFSSQTIGIATGLYLFLLTSRDFWPETQALLGRQPGTLTLLAAGLACLFIGTCVIVSWKKMRMKPLFVVLVLLTASAVWLLDQDSPFRANGGTAGDFAAHMVLFGLVPMALLLWARVRHGSFFWQMRGNLAVAVPALAIALCVMATHLTDYISIVGEEMGIAGVEDTCANVTVHP
ncbi:phosphoethanolamine transferase domain-containing protein [Shinella sp. CPCC 101442]|uniref:phosphoethanolamine transferase domain-containing protein n=1 Tax=Shinella sp. CPCC 101442 TaxID=2932265 RepID=UPI0021535DF5|nr:phosphoethanolamine transferase domain-containing protein [Shinella sp. CPCC 101442]MCR6500182.1 phosphoethanolamine transferase domain-containing protein [Shinella sp. CPCC 101442]